MTSSTFMESLVGVRAHALHSRIVRELGWSNAQAADFLTRVGLSLLSALRNHPDLDIARLKEEAELFTLVTTIDFKTIVNEVDVDRGDAWRGARWTAVAVAEALLDRTREGQLRLAGALGQA